MKEEMIKLNRSGIIALTGPFRWIFIHMILFFISAGHFNITRAWVYFGTCLVLTLVNTVISYKLIPGLLNERGKVKEGTKKWDKLLLIIYFSTFLLIVPVVAGLDIGRYRWSYLGVPYFAAGLVMYLITIALVLWAMMVNTHFEGTVRIQNDRDHTVVTTGPYRFIRHPGYVGMILGSLSIPFMIGSAYTLIPVSICIITVIVRTALEDKTLKAELAGYAEFAEKTKYRLIPGIW